MVSASLPLGSFHAGAILKSKGGRMSNVFAILSEPFEKFHYKLVAGVIQLPD